MQIVAPHHCYECGKTGSCLCSNCKYDITSEPFSGCILCWKPATDGICSACCSEYSKAWCVSERSGSIERLIDAYKFNNARAVYKDLAELMDISLPMLPPDTIVVPVPTISSHIRIRGYDHAALVARHLAKLRKLKYSPLLSRKSSSVQRGSSRKDRFKQAEEAFKCTSKLSPEVPYLLVDDVVTTGASIQFAAKTLRSAGAMEVWVAVIARQPLDKP